MARRRDNRAPFEVMGASTAPAREARPLAGESDAEQGGNSSRFSLPDWDELLTWWRGGTPVVLRLPRGFAVLFGVGLLGLVVLAYWVGHAQGEAAAREVYGTQETARIGGRMPAETVANPVVVDRRTASEDPSAHDPREPGLNYMILARYPRADAERLAQFMGERGVATAIVSSDNPELFHVIHLEGYTAAQMQEDGYRAYRKRMRDLGFEWRTANGGRGDALSTMYPQLYNP